MNSREGNSACRLGGIDGPRALAESLHMAVYVGRLTLRTRPPRTGVKIPILFGKRESPQKRAFRVKNPNFPVVRCRRKGVFLTRNDLGEREILGPETLFSRFWGF